ncbi:N-acetylneuraminate synthase [Alicyclobacillus sp. SO9]|uniref:N-acetylneuraminate synthase n=1 Tax=Alicyclobacillus sp. SO9 TaxID=2665646 RepID=UPI0018E7C545|nr:N-acetylneuraminate synthase [Alicyclobacillus sp. SO9]QQE78262.1 N-acetylneuraminate synthase [Alicyclobacillus sp. SO9]
MPKGRTLVVAEIGVNHNGLADVAKQLIDAAANAGADAVKFQTFNAQHLVRRDTKKAAYQELATPSDESQYDMLHKLQLSAKTFGVLKDYCEERQLEFISTPFDEPSVDVLNDLKVDRLKVASGDITSAPLLLKIARSRKPIILSTGMATIGEVETALSILAFGLTESAQTTAPLQPNAMEFRRHYLSESGQAAIAKFVTLLHATSEYPAPFEHVNLRAMDTLASTFSLPAGLSDHTSGITIAIAAAARGAAVIEKHLTLNRSLPGPDHRASLEPAEFEQMVRAVRQTESALGSSMKQPSVDEQNNAQLVRKSVVAARFIRKGEVLGADNVTTKRPAEGISAAYYYDVLGKTASQDFEKDEPIQWI